MQEHLENMVLNTLKLFLDLQCNNKVFRTKFDKEAYLQGKEAYIPEGKDYWIVDNALSGIKIPKEKTVIKEKRCKCCGIEIGVNRKVCDTCKSINESNRHVVRAEADRLKLSCSNCDKPITRQSKTGMCNSCANVKAKASNKSMKPSKEELIKLLLKYNQKEIAQMYQRSTGTVNTWLDSYGLK